MAQYVYTMRRVGKVVPPKRVILEDISLSFFPGAKIGVLGLNGAGKSSLLKIMAASAICRRSRSSTRRKTCAATSKKASPAQWRSSTASTRSANALPIRWTTRR
jgi:ATPase subunit of ABC transporter with duplicated ATPase domains